MVGDPQRQLFDPAGSAETCGGPPWGDGEGLAEIAFATIWATGPDPESDAPFRLQALRRRAEDGTWKHFDQVCDPFADGRSRAGAEERRRVASQRMTREYGLSGADLEGAPTAEAAFVELHRFLAGAPVIVREEAELRTWERSLTAGIGTPLELHDLTSTAAFLLPGRLASLGEELPARLLELDPGHRGRAVGPEELRSALGVLVGRTLEADQARLALLGHVALEVQQALTRGTGDAGPLLGSLAFGLTLLEHPSTWRGERSEGLYPAHAALEDGALSSALRTHSSLGEALDALEPRWARKDAARGASLSPVAEDPAPLDAADRRAVDEIFQVHLPRRLAREGGEPSYREGQHRLAARLAESFGDRELLLLHAPTGTGKTLAYLVPTLLWAYRNQVRVGVATFTRALQEQAMERDVPLTLEMLERVDVRGARVCVLKGRRNYLCWRALVQDVPRPSAPAQELLAWCALILFGTSDESGDVDRISMHPPLGSIDAASWSRTLGRALRRVRAATGCCSRSADRRACGAEAARRRAERSHLVVTNHAFAMARREYFRHLVFDECEHLHDVAHDAFSHAVGLRELRRHVGSLVHGTEESPRAGKKRSGRTIGRLAQVLEAVGATSAAGALAVECLETGRAAERDVEQLARALAEFKRWRAEEAPSALDTESHALLRAYLGDDGGAGLLRAQAALSSSLAELCRQLEALGAELEAGDDGHGRRLRRSVEIQRGDLEEMLAGVEAWIPRAKDTGLPLFGPHTFHDLETTPQREDVLAARVLLPHEHLGRHYYPDLAGAALLSATTWIKGGFETAATYLGLARAADPAEEEERGPSRLETFRAPEAFDYGRVLVAVPRDAPTITADKRAFLEYTARFVGFLAERTRGRLLVLFTNANDLVQVARPLEGFLAERHLPFWYQRMEGSSKEELGERFRAHADSVLFGLDTFWYGTDFPGETLEYLVLVRLPYGVPDRYHEAQCAALGKAEQRRQIYMPRSLSKFRQGFGRLMRRESDRGCVFLLDKRCLDPRHRSFLRELPVQRPFEMEGEREEGGAELVTAETDRCIDAALAHMDLKTDVRRRGLEVPFEGWTLESSVRTELRRAPAPDVASEDVPF